MESGRRLHCWIVRVEGSDTVGVRGRARSHRTADPFIAGLIAKLQREVREERRLATSRGRALTRCDRFARLPHAEQSEAELTWRDTPLYFTEPDFDAWEHRSMPPGER